MKLFDMHTHLYSHSLTAGTERTKAAQKELLFRKTQGIASCINCGTPEEWQWMQEIQGIQKETLLSFGIHPWYSDQYEPENYMEAFRTCNAVGEIGMDSVWCSVPLKQQESTFRKQLAIAADLQKPIILHTKGQEHRIAQLIRNVSEKICIHWYSGSIQELQPYLEMDCYFTLGPDFSVNKELYRYMMKTVPMDRLFLESDGIASIIWAEEENLGRSVKLDVSRKSDTEIFALLPKALRNTVRAAAVEKQLSEEMLLQLMWENRAAFFFDSKVSFGTAL